jgi:hypothetical protein
MPCTLLIKGARSIEVEVAQSVSRFNLNIQPALLLPEPKDHTFFIVLSKLWGGK